MQFLAYANFPQNQKSHKARTLCTYFQFVDSALWSSITVGILLFLVFLPKAKKQKKNVYCQFVKVMKDFIVCHKPNSMVPK